MRTNVLFMGIAGLAKNDLPSVSSKNMTTFENQQKISIELIPKCDRKEANFPLVSVVLNQINDSLEITYTIQDPESVIEWPQIESTELRQDNLWASTCFEFFHFLDGQSYREWNFSPTLHWQAYDFSSYRSPLPPRQAEIKQGPLIKKSSQGLSVSLSQIQLKPESFINPTAIIKLKSGEILPYAFEHPKLNADFHNKEAFKTWSFFASHKEISL